MTDQPTPNHQRANNAQAAASRIDATTAAAEIAYHLGSGVIYGLLAIADSTDRLAHVGDSLAGELTRLRIQLEETL